MTKSTIVAAIEPAYVPGICNINYEEIAQRRLMGHIGLGVLAIGVGILLSISIDRYYRIILLLPALLAASGYLQARQHFCVGYASAGKQNATEGSKQAVSIEDKSAKAADKRKALRMNAESAGIALLVTAIVLALPHL